MNPNFSGDHIFVQRTHKDQSRRPNTFFTKTLCLSLLLIGVFTAGSAQTIRRVNNNPQFAGPNVYSTAQEAHDAANPNDILLIEASGADYGLLTVTKPLKIYGNGYLLDVHTELSAYDKAAHFYSIEFHAGSDGSEMYGIEADNVSLFGVSNCIIKHCLVFNETAIVTSNYEGTSNNNVSNIILHGNMFMSVQMHAPDLSYAISDVTITNNIVYGNITVPGTFTQDCIVSRNTFLSGAIVLYNGIFENNICRDLSYVELGNVSYNFNVSSKNEFPAGTGNQNNFDLTNEFTVGISDQDEALWKPKDTSPLKTAASDGGEVGAFGGPDPYVLSGIGPMPLISEILVENPWTSEDVLRCTISVKSNN